MQVVVNGEPREVSPGTVVQDVLGTFDLQQFGVAVERNRKIVRRRDLASTVLEDGDRVEVVTLVGGG